MARIEAFQYCKLQCFYAVDYDDVNKKICLVNTDYMLEHFGRYAVVIRDKDEFIRRIETKLQAMDADYLMERVNYNSRILNEAVKDNHHLNLQTNIQEDIDSLQGEAIDVFIKTSFMKDQREWRICALDRPYGTDPLRIDIPGCFKDIVKVIDSNRINDYLLQMFPKYGYSLLQPSSESGYQSNVFREELTEKIKGIDGKYRYLAILGGEKNL